ncbi:MAG: M2 family metallopeptidase [Thermoleophilia bacterium]|nr:M2 family metallopeptidase [Thermoleophilia bacterium]
MRPRALVVVGGLAALVAWLRSRGGAVAPDVAGPPPEEPPAPSEREPGKAAPETVGDGLPHGWTVVEVDGQVSGAPAARPGDPARRPPPVLPDLVAELETRVRPLSIAANLAGWEANVAATEETEARRIETALALSDALADPELFAGVEAASGDGGDPVARRQLELFHNALLPHQLPAGLRRRIVELEASVESRFVRHRGVVAGAPVSDNEIKRILQVSDDVAERRDAWEASKTVGAAVADDVRELARLRNEAARSLGRRDWFALAVETSEMDEARLLRTLADADRATAEPFARWKATLDRALAERFGCAEAELRPWHYADPFFQEVPPDGGVDLDVVFEGRDPVELTRRTYDGLGLETRPVLDRSDLYPRDHKSQHAFCLDVDREGDVRVLCNVVPSAYWMDTMLHELGHGVFSTGHDPSLPWLLRDAHLTTTEGMAILAGRLSSDQEWLERVVGLASEEAAGLSGALRRARAAEIVVFARWVLVMTSFERRLYADPEQDLDACWWELVHRYQGVTPPDGRRAPDWAAKIHIACAPVYYHTYLYGHLVASQLSAMLHREAGGLVDRPEAGELLAGRLFAPGESVRWDRLVERATGAPLHAADYAAEIAAGLS